MENKDNSENSTKTQKKSENKQEEHEHHEHHNCNHHNHSHHHKRQIKWKFGSIWASILFVVSGALLVTLIVSSYETDIEAFLTRRQTMSSVCFDFLLFAKKKTQTTKKENKKQKQKKMHFF